MKIQSNFPNFIDSVLLFFVKTFVKFVFKYFPVVFDIAAIKLAIKHCVQEISKVDDDIG